MEKKSDQLSPRVRKLLEDMRRDLDNNGTIPIGIFNDQELHEAEMELLFGKQWNYIGHESEISSPGDYVLRYVGKDQFIFVRDEHGEIRVLLDACRHRGVSVCRAEKGNASHFRCVYHGWTYKNTGEMIGAPGYKDAYSGLKKEEWGLIHAPRMENFYGFIFISLAQEGPDLVESLGGMAWYLEMLLSLQKEGMEVLGEPQRWIVNANWKQAAENFSGDDYHLLYLHKSTYDVGVMPVPLIENMKGYHIKPGNGHGVSFSMDLDPNAPGPKYWFFPEEIVETFNNLKSMSIEQQEFARASRVTVGTIFPNTSFLLLPLSADPSNLPPVPLFTWRVWRPMGPDKIELINWFFMYKNTPPEFKALSYRAAMANFGISGTFEMDDTIPWESTARVAGAPFAKKALKLNFQMGMEGMSSSKLVEDWPFPGEAWYPRFEEGNQRFFYRHYLDVMLNGN
jgi:phenylpropionate dioxygenase-like ring-hydroxylating dioxygenase large terminal subunit